MPDFKGVASNEVTGNVARMDIFRPTLSPTAVAANTTAEQTFTLNGLLVGDIVIIGKPTAQAGLGIVGARVSAANTLAVTFSNNTAASITPTASQQYTVLRVR